MFSLGRSPLVKRLFFGLLIFIAALGFFKVGARAWFEMRGSFHTDAAIYGAVSRGWLHGLTPYADLFENKTPLIFLLAAVSFALSGSLQILSLLQGVVIMLLPFSLLLPFFRKHGRWPPLIITLLAFILGCALSLYTADQAGQLLPESFGAFFGSFLIATLVAFDDGWPWTWKRRALVTALLLLTVGTKEPFLLVIVGATLILFSWRQTFHALAVPLMLAIAVGVAGLVALGLVGPYFSIHVGHMFSYHVTTPWGTLDEPLWLRFIDVIRVWKNMWGYSPFLPFVLFDLWIGALFYLLRDAADAGERVRSALRWLVGSVLTTAAVGLTGDFYGHHFIFAVPFFVACFFVCLRASSLKNERWHVISVVLIAGFCALLFANAPVRWPALFQQWKTWADERQETADLLDAVLDRCRMDRYFFFVDRPDGLYVFTRHSPYGPLFTQYSRFVGARQQYLDGFTDAMTNAPIMVMRTNEEGVPLDPGTLQFLRTSFTQQPWACAQGVSLPAPYRLFFRIGSEPSL